MRISDPELIRLYHELKAYRMPGRSARMTSVEPHLEGDRDVDGGQRRRSRRHRIGFQLMIELYQFGIGRRLALAVQPLQEMARPFGEGDGARRQPFGMKSETPNVERLAQQPRRDILWQRHHHAGRRYPISRPVI